MKRYLIMLILIPLGLAAVYGAFLFGRHMRSTDTSGSGAGGIMALPQTRQMDLYFADPAGQRLSIERREVTGENREDLYARVVQELIRGPVNDDRLRTLPETVRE